MPEHESVESSEFTEFVATVEGGRIAEDAAHHLRELIAELRRVANTSGGTPKGKLKLEFAFKYDRGMVEVDGAIGVTLPRAKRERTLLWIDKDGKVLAHNPSQMVMELPAGPAPVRDIPAAESPAIRKVV